MNTAKDFEILEEDRTDELYNRFLSKFDVESEDSCWIWEASKDKNEYGQFSFKGKKVLAHRFSYVFFKCVIPENLITMHICDRPSCVNPKHLEIGTQLENNIDCVKKGRNIKKGTNNGRSKLSEENVVIIKKMLKRGFSQKDIASMFEMDRSIISLIHNNKRWSHVTI